METVRLVHVLPSIRDALANGLAVPPSHPGPMHWRAYLVPNLADWQPGDVVVASRIGWKGALISDGQALVLPADVQEPDWTHCGMYLGSGSLLNAQPREGLVQRSLEEFCNVRHVAVLRLVIGKSLLDPLLGQEVANAATALAGNRYATRSLANIALRYMVGGFGAQQPPVERVPREFYCSSLAVVAFRVTLGITLDDDPSFRLCLPANLPAHRLMSSIEVDWHRAL